MNTLDDNTDIDRQLSAAGARLRADAPDAIATEQSYRHRHDQRIDAHPTPARSWWPTIVGFGLVASAIVGVVMFRSIDDAAEVQVPADESPVPTLDTMPLPTTTIAPATTVLPPSDPLLDEAAPPITTIPPSDGVTIDEICGPLGSAPPGFSYDVLNCRGDDPSTALVAQYPTDGSLADATRWFTTASVVSPGVELTEVHTVAGLSNALSFLVDVDGVTCTVVIDPRPLGDWREICGFDGGIVLAPWNADFVRFDLTDPRGVTATPILDPINGCDRIDLAELAVEATISGLFTSVGCDGDTAAISAGSVFTQPGPPDGAIFVYGAAPDGSWALVDSGTDVGDVPLAELPTD